MSWSKSEVQGKSKDSKGKYTGSKGANGSCKGLENTRRIPLTIVTPTIPVGIKLVTVSQTHFHLEVLILLF